MVSDWNPLEREYGMEEFADMLKQLRRELLERLEAREDRVHRDMVGLIDAMQRLDMPPPHALTAAFSIAAAIDAPATRDFLIAFGAGLTGVLGEEVASGERDAESLQPLDKGGRRRRLK